MADTARTVAALQTLLANNVTGDISPQDLRDFLVTSLGVFGGIGIPTLASATQALTADTPAKITLFTAEVIQGVTASHANDQLTIVVSGWYKVNGCFSMESSAGNTIFDFIVNVDGSPSSVAIQRKVSTGGDVGAASFSGLIELTAGEVLTLEATADDNTTLKFTRAHFNAELIG